MNMLVIGGIIGGAYRRLKVFESIKTIALKGFSAFLVWLCLTAVMIVASAAFFYGDSLNEGQRIIKLESATIYFLMFFIGWVFAGFIIIYLINRLNQKKII
jgi:hypothetical protein